MSPEEDLRARILAKVAEKPSRTRPEGRTRAALYYAGSAALMIAIFFVAGGFAHAEGRPPSVSGPILLGETVIALAATWAVLGRGRRVTGRARFVLAIAAIAVPAVVFPWLTWWHGSYVEPFEREGWMCLTLTLVMAAALLGALLVVRRRSDATHPAALGAAVGAVSGAWADLVVDAWCPLTNAPHVLLGHVAPIALLVGFGALVGKGVLGVKA
jgi:hypothetical protein